MHADHPVADYRAVPGDGVQFNDVTSIGFTDVVNLEGGMLAVASSNEGAQGS